MMDNPKNNTFLNRVKQSGQVVSQFLIEPPAVVTEPDARLKARAVSALLLLTGLSFSLGAITTFSNGSSIGIMPLWVYLTITAVLMFSGYGMSRTGYYVWGAAAIASIHTLLFSAS